MKLLISIFSAAVIFLGVVNSYADTSSEKSAQSAAIGFTIDFLPIAMSAAAGHAGYSFQTWVGYGHTRIRAVGAQIYFPDSLAVDSSFKNQSLTAGAFIIDYVFGEHFNGFWLGTGIELWQNRITGKTDGLSAEWTNQVLTVGGGYIFPVKGNFYIEPWWAAHCIMNNRKITAGNNSFTPKKFSAEISLKAGFFFDI